MKSHSMKCIFSKLLPVIICCAMLSGLNVMAQSAGIGVGSVSGLPGATVTVPIGFTAGTTAVSTLQFNLTFSSSLVYGSTATGAAATAVSKTASANAISGGICVLVFGLNNNAIGSGVIANIQFTIPASDPAGTVPIAISGIVASDPNASAVAVAGTSGNVQVLGSPDTTPPTIGITSPTSGLTYTTSSSPLSISGTASDNVGVTQVTWVNSAGGSGTATGTTSWSVTGIGLVSGSNILTVKAWDAAGNSGTATLTVTYNPSDTTPPTIAITSPTSGLTYTTSSSPLSIGGTASDNVGVTQVTWVNSTGGSGTATGTTSWSVAGIALVKGSNVLTVTALDAAGNSGTATLTVTYNPPDTTPPIISSVAASSVTGSGATLTWTTNEPADTQVEYGTTPAYGTSTIINSTMTTSHSQGLTGLTGSTLYHYHVKSRDAAGNLAISGDYTFTTTTAPDTTPPIISGVSSSKIKITSAAVGWTTNEPADTQIQYGTTTAYGSSTTLSSMLSTAHSQALTGLTPQTVYHYLVESRDAAGNLATSSDYTFTTAPLGTPPVISAVAISNISNSSATISWTTDKPSDSAVEYWPAGQNASLSALNDLGTLHSLTLNGLQKLTQYYFLVKSCDSDGNQAVTPTFTFNTLGTVSSMIASPRFLADSGANQNSADDIMVGMALTNMGSVSATISFTAVDDSGNLVAGTDITNPGVSELNPWSQSAVMDSDVFGDGITASNSTGWIKLASTSSDVNGFFLMFDDKMSFMDGTSFGSSPLNNFIFSELEPDGSTKIDIANVSPNDANVTLNLMGSDGTIRSSQSQVIPSNGALVADLYNDIFSGVDPDPTDYVSITSTQGVQPFELMQQSVGDISILGGQDVTAGGTTLYSPQYVVGDSNRTNLTVVNLDNVPGMVTLQLIGNDGVPIGTTQTIALSGNGKVYIDDPGFFLPLEEGQTTVGYVEVTSDGIRLAGSTVYTDNTGQSFCSALPLIYNLQNSITFSHVASNGQFFTGIAILNPNATDANVVIELHNSDGTLLATRTDVLTALQKTAQVLTEYFPSLIGKDQTTGYIRVTSDQPIASFSVFGTNNLSVLSAIPAQ